ncbi:MAG TPA: PRC-barrel domain-containing protein [Modicisalibacter sp.]|nr:PRC-barrel domain-containing protein [Modicisalibacter sp.]
MQLNRNLSTLALAIASVTVMSQVHANQDQSAQQTQQTQQNGNANGEVRAISEWNYDEIYQDAGIEADRLMDAEVFGPEGEEIGNIENVLLNEKNQIIAIIAEVGGFWDIGDTHIAVSWEEVELTEDGFQIPVTEDNVDDYELFGEGSYITLHDVDEASQVDDDLATGPRVWKLTDLLDDYATIDDGIGYGYIENALFTEKGALQAIVVDPSGEAYGYGPYAYPFYGYGYGWEPGLGAYDIPYTGEEVAEMEPFDYEEYDGFWD